MTIDSIPYHLSKKIINHFEFIERKRDEQLQFCKNSPYSEKVTSSKDSYISFMKAELPKIISNEKSLISYLNDGDMLKYRSELDDMKGNRDLINHGVNIRQQIMSEMIKEFSAKPEMEDDSTTAIVSRMTESIDALERYEALSARLSISAVASEAESTLSSSKEICYSLSIAIGSISENYLDVFQYAVGQNAAFYKDFSDFMSQLKNYISATDDKTILDAKSFRDALNSLMSNYSVPTVSTTLFPAPKGSNIQGASESDCIAWAKEMGLNPDNCVTKLSDGSYIVHVDVTPLQSIRSLVSNEDKITFNSAQWAAFQSGLDIQKDSIQTGMQTLTQKYSNANSTYDNLVKVLSSTISSLLESDKAFLQI